MLEFDSTFDEPAPKVVLCVVYDQDTGHVLSMHRFAGDGTGLFGPEGAGERERMALELAQRDLAGRDLRVMHAPHDFRLEALTLYRVDPRTRAIHGSRIQLPLGEGAP